MTSAHCAANAAAFEALGASAPRARGRRQRHHGDDRPRQRGGAAGARGADRLPAALRSGRASSRWRGLRRAAGTVMTLSTLSSVTPAELAAAAPGATQWFQLYWSRDRGFTQGLVAAAVEAGFAALMLPRSTLPGRRPTRARRARRLRASGGPAAAEHPRQTLRREDFHSGTARGRRRHAHLARPRMAALDLPAAVGRQGDPDRRGRAARRRARRRSAWSSRITAGASSTACRQRSTSSRRWSRRSADAGRGAGRRRHPPRHRTCSRRSPSARGPTLAGRAVLCGLAVDGEAGAASVLELLRAESSSSA